MWPFKDIAYDQGLLVQNLAINHPYQTVKDGLLAIIGIAKSANSITYTREAQKISSVFSFIGGMVSAASAILFFIKGYTSFAFQISIAFSMFQPRKEQQIKPKPSINFLTFIKLQIYLICSKLGLKLEWQISVIWLSAKLKSGINWTLNLFQNGQFSYNTASLISFRTTNSKDFRQISQIQSNLLNPSVKNAYACLMRLDHNKMLKINEINKNNIIVQPESSSSNFQMRRHSRTSKVYKHHNLIIVDHKSSQQFQPCQKIKKKAIVHHSPIQNIFEIDENRTKNLRLPDNDSKNEECFHLKVNQREQKMQMQKII